MSFEPAALARIAVLMKEIGRSEEASKYLDLAYIAADKSSYVFDHVFVQFSEIETSHIEGNRANVLAICPEIIAYCNQGGAGLFEGMSHCFIGWALCKDNPEKALQYLDRGIDIIRSREQAIYLNRALLTKAEVLSELEQTNEAIDVLDAALNSCIDHGHMKLARAIEKDLMKLRSMNSTNANWNGLGAPLTWQTDLLSL